MYLPYDLARPLKTFKSSLVPIININKISGSLQKLGFNNLFEWIFTQQIN